MKIGLSQALEKLNSESDFSPVALVMRLGQYAKMAIDTDHHSSGLLDCSRGSFFKGSGIHS
jgi:hypothetical protein